MLFIIFFLIFIINCNKNIIKNPSFEELDSDGIIKFWNLNSICDISNETNSGNNSLHWKESNKRIINSQTIELEKDFKYEICVNFKLKNIIGKGFRFYIENKNHTQLYERYYFSYYSGTNDWKKVCHETGNIIKPSGDLDRYIFGAFTLEQEDSNGEVFIDDISIYRINDLLKIVINNDRDEVYDNVNIVYKIDINRGNYKLKDWILKTRIKDNNETIYEEKIDYINTSFFTISMDLNKINLKNNQFYKIEALLESKIDDTINIDTYTFKKINKTERKVTFDLYGRMYINNELFFPFGIYVHLVNQNDLKQINRTHLNLLISSNNLSLATMDMIDKTQNGRIKLIYSVKDIFYLNKSICQPVGEEGDYKEYVKKINYIKNHPILIGWYINDEIRYCFNKNLRNRTQTIHELDPDHPSLSVINKPGDVPLLLNTTDIMGLDNYPIGYPGKKINNVYIAQNETYNNMLKTKPFWPVVQIFDWYYGRKDNPEYKPCPPTLQEMRSMSWQAFVAGGKGMIFYSLYDLYRMNSTEDHREPFEERFSDVIEFTDQIWKYKDVILSVEKINEIEYKKNDNVVFKQWKYNDSNYIVIVNLERTNETFQLNLLKKSKVIKEFGLGTFEQKGNNIILNLQPIDVFMIKYTFDNSDNSDDSENSLLIIILVIISLLILIIILLFFGRKYYIKKKNKINFESNGAEPILNNEI